MSIVNSLLASGADVNAHNGAALCLAVEAADNKIADALFAARPGPNPASLARALPHALRIPDPMERQTFAEKILQAGAPPVECNRALCHAIKSLSEELGLIRTLLASADVSDGEALACAVKKGNPRIVELVLQKAKYSVAVLNAAFSEATKVKDKPVRVEICTALLRAGVSENVASDALLAASGDGDTMLSQVLMRHGGSIRGHDGQAVVEACRSGSTDVLRILLGGRVAAKKSTLERGFQAATEVRDLAKRAEIFKILLEKGVSGDVVNAQLVSAVRYGEEGQVVIRVLLEAGADPNYNSGEAVWAATRNAFLVNLDMMLGNIAVGGQQVRH